MLSHLLPGFLLTFLILCFGFLPPLCTSVGVLGFLVGSLDFLLFHSLSRRDCLEASLPLNFLLYPHHIPAAGSSLTWPSILKALRLGCPKGSPHPPHEDPQSHSGFLSCLFASVCGGSSSLKCMPVSCLFPSDALCWLLFFKFLEYSSCL